MKLRVILEPSDEGGYTVYVPSLPGCISEGENVDVTTAGRIFRISAPTVGSKLTNQISPRLGVSGLIINDVTCH